MKAWLVKSRLDSANGPREHVVVVSANNIAEVHESLEQFYDYDDYFDTVLSVELVANVALNNAGQEVPWADVKTVNVK